MSKLTFTVILLGCALFFFDISYGIGWLIGWLFILLLGHFRERILERIINFDNFSFWKYLLYLLGVMVWIAIPLLFSLLAPNYINPIAIFGAYIVNRILMFITNAIVKEG